VSASQLVGCETPSGGPLKVPRQLKYFLKKVIGMLSHESWNKFFVKWAQNQSLGKKWAAPSKRLRSTALSHAFQTCHVTSSTNYVWLKAK